MFLKLLWQNQLKKKKMRNDDNLIPGACNKYNQTVFMSYTQIILINR